MFHRKATAFPKMGFPFRLHQSNLVFSKKVSMKQLHTIYQSKKKPSLPHRLSRSSRSCSPLTADKNYLHPLSHPTSNETLNNNITSLYLSQENQACYLPKKLLVSPSQILPAILQQKQPSKRSHPNPFSPQNPLLSPFIFPSSFHHPLPLNQLPSPNSSISLALPLHSL